MIINIPLGGELRRIRWDKKQFIPYDKSGTAIAFCTKFGNAVTYLVKDVACTDEVIDKHVKDDVLSIAQFVNRFERILDDIKKLTPEDFKVQPVEEEPIEVTTRKPVYPTAPVEEEEIDGL